MDNKILYNEDRSRRWNMAKEKEPEAIEFICNALQEMSGHKVEQVRFDKLWFDQYPIEENEWVKGASDYVIRIDESHYVYAEIKLKSFLFRKTVTGGKTQKGSLITKYGCESFYLDIVPVYQNMCAFVEKTKIDSNHFVIFFVDENISKVHALSLKEIQDLVENGYEGKKLCIFSEGYGTKTKYGAAPNYLIPSLATSELDFQYILDHSSDTYIRTLPENAAEYYHSGTPFYHSNRKCRYIASKPENQVHVVSEEDIKRKRLIPCRECCK
jgi:hypothetical protein